MPENNPNNIPQQLGKISESVDKFQTLSGQVVEVRHYEIAIMDNGILRKQYFKEIFPPLSDGRICEIKDIRECSNCSGLYHFENVLTCPVCGRYFCHLCKVQIAKDDKQMIVCRTCAEELNTGFFKKLFKKLWNMER